MHPRGPSGRSLESRHAASGSVLLLLFIEMLPVTGCELVCKENTSSAECLPELHRYQHMFRHNAFEIQNRRAVLRKSIASN